jgi:hypothetical protein
MSWESGIFDWVNQNAPHLDFSFEMRNVSLTPSKAGAYDYIGYDCWRPEPYHLLPAV